MAAREKISQGALVADPSPTFAMNAELDHASRFWHPFFIMLFPVAELIHMDFKIKIGDASL